MFAHLHDVTSHQPRKPLVLPASTVPTLISNTSSDDETHKYMYIQPPLVVMATLATAPSTFSERVSSYHKHTSASIISPARHSTSACAINAPPPAPIFNCFVRELGHEVDVYMPECTQRKKRTMQASHHSMGMMSTFEHARLANQLVGRETIDETMREHGLQRTRLDLLTAQASIFSTPPTVVKAEASEHADI